jgi:RNA polymerase sigma-70 factor (ECF subfamily)
LNAEDPQYREAQWVAARAGDARAINALVREHQRMVYSLGMRLLRNRAAAEDLTQDVFMQFFQQLATLDSAAHARHWLLRVATHRAIDQLRRRPPAAASDEVPSPGEASEAGDALLAARLRALIGELPPDPRVVIVLRYQEDMDPTDIAELLDMPLNTVKSHLRRALEVLRERLT